jgi:arginyl-tRNA synthetase
MITADLRGALLAAAGAAGANSEYADPGLRPAGAPGRYASSLPFRLAAASGRAPADIATALATQLSDLPWLESAAVTGEGYVTVTVTPDTLAALAVRITLAGPASATSNALSDLTMTAPPAPARTALDWPQAKKALAAHLTARLATAAGARVTASNAPERVVVSAFPDLDGPRGGQPAAAPESPVARAIAYAGEDAVRYALARLPPGGPVEVDAVAGARQVPENPAFTVRYAHACAASELRWAAACGFTKGDPGEFRPDLLTDPRELALLDAASWLPERVAAAARRARPDEFCGYLEDLAGAYQNCFAGNPVWPACCAGEEPAAVRPGEARESGARESGARDSIRARLWLADAARTCLATGLGLLEVSAPDRL